MKKNEMRNWQDKAAKALAEASIVITESEKESIEIADFGLNKFEEVGLAILTYVNTSRVCAKELIMLPNQICPEHRHPNRGQELGKEETFRCRKGQVSLYICNNPNSDETKDNNYETNNSYSIYKRVVLNEGEQYTISPDTNHWFKAGLEGAIVSEFSTTSTDELDIFTDPKIIR